MTTTNTTDTTDTTETNTETNNTTATRGTTVKVHYRGTLTDGTEFDNSNTRGTPIEFTVGAGQMIRGFDTAVEGMTIGETKTVNIPCAEAYGETNPEANTQIPRSAFPADLELTEDMPVPLRGPQGQPFTGRITTLTEETVTVDLNHPLAGQDLQFEIELVEVQTTSTDTTNTITVE